MKKITTILISICTLDLLILGLAYLFHHLVLFFTILLLTILILFIGFPILISEILLRQIMSPREYYLEMIENHYDDMNDDILIKMFEFRINSYRNSLFTFFVITVSFTLTIIFNEKAYDFFENLYGGARFIIAILMISIFLLTKEIFGLDKSTVKEFQILFKAKERLKEKRKKINN